MVPSHILPPMHVPQLDPIQMQKFKITENELAERKAFVDKAEKVLNSKFFSVDYCDEL